MENKIAVIAIIVHDTDSVEKVNALLHEYREHIVGRMGIPHHNDVSVISIVIDAPMEIVNGLSGKLGMVSGIQSKVLTAK